jgi:hypothetical protein
LRLATGITGERAGAALHATGSKISRVESGQVPVRERDVEALLDLYGEGSPAARDELLALARESARRGWWDPYSDLVPTQVRHCLELEAAASVIATYDCLAVPALLQTEEYAQAVAASEPGSPAWRGGLGPRTLEHRRSLLSSAHPPKLWALVDESVLSRPAPGPGVMAEQLAHLVKMASQPRPRITVQIVPNDRAAALAAAGPFTILRFPAADLADVVFLELLATITCLERRPAVDQHWRVFNLLATSAMSPEESFTALQRMAGPAGPQR